MDARRLAATASVPGPRGPTPGQPVPGPPARPGRVGLAGYLALVLALAGCAPDFCDRWAEARCTRLWLCTVEHARYDPAFIAAHGDSPAACRRLEGDRCAAEPTCAAPAEAERCLRSAAGAPCGEPVTSCAPPCE